MHNPDFALNLAIVVLQTVSLAAMIVLYTHRTIRVRRSAWLLVVACVLGLGMASTAGKPGDTQVVMAAAATVSLLLLAALATSPTHDAEKAEELDPVPVSVPRTSVPRRGPALPLSSLPARHPLAHSESAYLTRRAGGLAQLSL